jgi:metallo-beta-lactamase class B
MLAATLAAGLAMGYVADVNGAAINRPPPPPPPVTPAPTPIDPLTMSVPDTLEAHIQAATMAAGTDLWGILALCLPGDPAGALPAADERARPAKVFDNLYYVGMRGVAAWALTTSQGVILIDSLNNPMEAQTAIEAGMREVGLDPAQIKHIVITHGHADHYGGAQYLADKYKAEIVMSEADWAFLEGPRAPQPRADRGPIPKRGRAVADGDKLTLGDTTIELYVTPPHTPGPLSLIFPVKDGGMSHMAGLWGGIGFVFEPNHQNFVTYAASADRFARLEAEKGVDVILANHPTFDDALIKIDALKSRTPGRHPFVTGPMTVARYQMVASQCAQARARALVEPSGLADPSGIRK